MSDCPKAVAPVAGPDPKNAAGARDVLRGIGLTKVFRRRGDLFAGPSLTAAVRNVSIRLRSGEIYGLVGESSCGKTTLARLLIGALAPNAGRVEATCSGSWKDVARMRSAETRRLRSRVQMVYQEADLALDPMMRCGLSVAEGYATHFPYLGSSDRMRLSARLFRSMALPLRKYVAYPGALSGGERKRVLIARAFAALGHGIRQENMRPPGLVIADELTSGMDGVIQARILEFLTQCIGELNLGCLLISHDLRLVKAFADRVAIMYAGRFVETGTHEALFKRDGFRHPFSRQLMAARGAEVAHPETADEAKDGCIFLSECPERDARCTEPQPLLGPDDHRVACWRDVDNRDTEGTEQ